MSYTHRRRSARRRPRSISVAAIVLCTATLVAIGHRWASSSATSAVAEPLRYPSTERSNGGPHAALDEADGLVPAGATVFDDAYPAVANLDPDLLAALRAAATDAAADGVAFSVDSGWRSRRYQAELFQKAVSEYGSAAEAAKWVAPATRSAHVTGDAVDIGPVDASAWLSEHGAEYGLCQIYANEPWHLEWRPTAIDDGCPPTYADATQDPRMHR